jgi:hypothetical protein
MTLKFDELIRNGNDLEALEYLSEELYNNGKMGYTRKKLLDRTAEKLKEREQYPFVITHRLDIYIKDFGFVTSFFDRDINKLVDLMMQMKQRESAYNSKIKFIFKALPTKENEVL